MSKSLDKVLQPDGSYKWELVELRACELYEKDKPAATPAPAPKRRSSKKTTEVETSDAPTSTFNDTEF
jgi:hypothetical protein